MKMSILMGVVHMNLGIIHSVFNHLYFRDRLSIICEFIPQVRAHTVACDRLEGSFCMRRSEGEECCWLAGSPACTPE
jgi:hypothetical protein